MKNQEKSNFDLSDVYKSTTPDQLRKATLGAFFGITALSASIIFVYLIFYLGHSRLSTSLSPLVILLLTIYVVTILLVFLIIARMLRWTNKIYLVISKLIEHSNAQEQIFSKRALELQHREDQIRNAADIARLISEQVDPDKLLQQIVDLVQDRFLLYYVGVFLHDEEGQYAVLKAGFGEAGQKMVSNGHRLLIGGNSMVGWATSHRKARIALDVGNEAVRFDNPDLPLTRSEMALPLISGDKVMGALSIQSDQTDAFDDEDIQVMQGVADSLAIALEKAQLIKRLETSLSEIQTLHRQYLTRSWKPVPEKIADAVFVAESTKDNPAVETTPQPITVEAPIQLRNQLIGRVQLDIEQSEWTIEQQAFVESVLYQTALALENARLLEETRYRADRDKLITNISRHLWETTDIPNILQTAVREIGVAFDVSVARIDLDDASFIRQREQ